MSKVQMGTMNLTAPLSQTAILILVLAFDINGAASTFRFLIFSYMAYYHISLFNIATAFHISLL
jgi:hypothetical protein